jgi:ribosomal protein S18 acetylase RimI-like enzyme
MNVRAAEPGDAADVVRLLGQLGYTRDEPSTRADLVRGEAGMVLVAVGGEHRVVGLLTMKTHRPFHLDMLVATIDALVVAEEQRSSGIGAALLAAAAERAMAAGCRFVELHSSVTRTEARRFYEREGFRITSNYFVRPLP